MTVWGEVTTLLCFLSFQKAVATLLFCHVSDVTYAVKKSQHRLRMGRLKNVSLKFSYRTTDACRQVIGLIYLQKQR